MARGHALLWGRQNISWDDVNFAIDINQTNMSEDRYRVFLAFDKAIKEYVKKGSSYEDMFDIGIGLREAARAIKGSEGKALRVLNELQDLGIIHQGDSGKWFRNI